MLETVARIPYFAYISILHLYESLGFWRAGAELRKVHFAEVRMCVCVCVCVCVCASLRGSAMGLSQLSLCTPLRTRISSCS